MARKWWEPQGTSLVSLPALINSDHKLGKGQQDAPRAICSTFGVFCSKSNLTREEGHLQLGKSAIWTHKPKKKALEKDILSLLSLSANMLILLSHSLCLPGLERF